MSKILTIKENILHFIESQSIKKDDFYKITGISASNFKGVGLKSEIGGDKIVKILSCYPNLSPEWLLTGKGSMLKENKKIPEPPPDHSHLLDLIEYQKKHIVALKTEIEELKKAYPVNQTVRMVAEPSEKLEK